MLLSPPVPIIDSVEVAVLSLFEVEVNISLLTNGGQSVTHYTVSWFTCVLSRCVFEHDVCERVPTRSRKGLEELEHVVLSTDQLQVLERWNSSSQLMVPTDTCASFTAG